MYSVYIFFYGCLHLRTEVRLTQWSLLQPVCAYEAPGDPFSEFLAAVTQIPPKSVPTPQPVLTGWPSSYSLPFTYRESGLVR